MTTVMIRFVTNSTLVTLIDRLTNRCADQIFAVSASVKDYLIRFEKVASARIRIIPPGLPDRMLSRRARGFAKVIGGAGRLVPQKNFGRFLRIASALLKLDDSYRFVIAGSGPLEAELKREASALGVNVEWFGVEPSLDRFFGEIDLYLLTSDFEGLPMVLLEALQHGVPVAAMAVDGIREEFSDEILLLNPAGDDRGTWTAHSLRTAKSDRALEPDSARKRASQPAFFCTAPNSGDGTSLYGSAPGKTAHDLTRQKSRRCRIDELIAVRCEQLPAQAVCR